MPKLPRPDSKRFARRAAAIIRSDLSDRSAGSNFVVSHISDVWDAKAGVMTYQLECQAPDGSRALITVEPLAAVVLAGTP